MVRVAGKAILCKIGVFIDERALLVHVTAGTHFFDGNALEILILPRAVRLVAIDAGHFLFAHGVPGKLGKLHACIDMTGITHLIHLMPAHLLLRSLMQFVAVKATDVTAGVDAAIPVVQIGC